MDELFNQETPQVGTFFTYKKFLFFGANNTLRMGTQVFKDTAGPRQSTFELDDLCSRVGDSRVNKNPTLSLNSQESHCVSLSQI